MRNLLKVTPVKLTTLLALVLATLVFLQDQLVWHSWLPYRLELKLLDAKYFNRGKVAFDPQVVIAAADEKALEQFGVWGSWPRNVYAQMLRNLFAAGADVVAFDMVWADEQKTADPMKIKRLQDAFVEGGFAAQAEAAQKRVEAARERQEKTEKALKDAQKSARTNKALKKAVGTLAEAHQAALEELAAAEESAQKLTEAATTYTEALDAAATGSADDELVEALAENATRIVLGYIASPVPEERQRSPEALDASFDRIRSTTIDRLYWGVNRVNGSPGGKLARTLEEMCRGQKGTCEVTPESVGMRAGLEPEVFQRAVTELVEKTVVNIKGDNLAVPDVGALLAYIQPGAQTELVDLLPGRPDERERDRREGVTTIEGDLITPLPKFAEVGQNFGFYSAEADVDGVFRSQPLMYRYFPSKPTEDPALCTECNRRMLTPDAISAMEDPSVCSAPCVDSCKECFIHGYYVQSLALTTVQQRRGFSVAPLRDADYEWIQGINRVALLPFDAVKTTDPYPIYVATDHLGRLLLNYYGKYRDEETRMHSFPHVSVADVVNNTFDKNIVKGKAILFATTALGTYDQRTTPFDNFVPGVHIHATAVQNMADGTFLQRPFTLVAAEMLFLILMGLLLGIILPRIPVPAALALVLALALGLWFVDMNVAFAKGLWVQVFFIYLQLFLTLIMVLAYGYFTVGREKAAMRKAFGACLDPHLVDELATNPDTIKKLKGDEREATCMFSDIRGFTTLSENLTPEELTIFLNDYFTRQADAIMVHKGYLDKYIGDAIMALFGAPQAFPDHAINACYASLDMMGSLKEFKKYVTSDPKWAGFCQRLLSKNMDPASFDVGIGINSGLMRVGYMGSQQRTNYSALGDAVNLSSRLEGQTKEYGVHIILGETTMNMVKGYVHGRLLDAIRVKGKKEPVRIYELIGKGDAPPEWAQFIKTFETGIEMFQARKFAEAIPYFAQALREKPMDAEYEEELKKKGKPRDLISAEYISRCMMYQENPPPADWDGVVTKTSK